MYKDKRCEKQTKERNGFTQLSQQRRRHLTVGAALHQLDVEDRYLLGLLHAPLHLRGPRPAECGRAAALQITPARPGQAICWAYNVLSARTFSQRDKRRIPLLAMSCRRS